MVLLLETAEVLELRARRSRDVAQVPVLLRRAEHRRREAARIRERLAARGAALPGRDAAPPDTARSADSQPTSRPVSPAGQHRR
jgi:hypothetical protein